MNLFGLMETSGSAMQAERMRAEVVAANMANAETTRTEDGGPYRRQHVIFAANANTSSFADVLGSAANNALSPGLLPVQTGPNQTGSNQAPGGVHVSAVV